VYGSEGVICRLTGDAGQARLHLMNYGGREIEGCASGCAESIAMEKPTSQARGVSRGRTRSSSRAGATEFSIPRILSYAVIDLGAVR
jgi:hypothetical protein